MNRPYEKLSDRYIGKIRTILSSMTGKTADEKTFVRLTNNLTDSIANCLENDTATSESIRNQECKVTGGWTKDLNELRSTYNKVYKAFTNLSDEERSIHRIERKSHFTALIFRFLTTLAIGFAIMLVYWVAGHLSIQMPLLRVPI